jgi:hypothetical protein
MSTFSVAFTKDASAMKKVHFARQERVTHLPFSSKIRYNIRVALQIPAREGGVSHVLHHIFLGCRHG